MRFFLSKLLLLFVLFFFVTGALYLKFKPAYAEKHAVTDLKGIAESNASLMPEIKKITNDPLMREVTQVGLFVIVPQAYLTAYQCQGREIQCANENGGLAGFPEKCAEYLGKLKETYSKYPKMLMPDNLVKEFTQKIEKQIYPFLDPKKISGSRSVKILRQEDYRLFSKNPGALLIIINLQFLDAPHTDQVLISRLYYRSDRMFNDPLNLFLRNYTDVIDIGNSEQDIAAQLDKFSTYSLGIRAEPQ